MLNPGPPQIRDSTNPLTLLLLIVLYLSLATQGCDFIDNQFSDLVEPPQEPIRSNPVDPDNPERIEPETDILGWATPDTIITTAIPTIDWTGNRSPMIFQWRRDGGEWSDWSEETTVVLGPLDEGRHQFEVRGGHSTIWYDESPASATFIVDAVKGPSLRFSPPDTLVDAHTILRIDIVAEEVSDLMAVMAVIKYDPVVLDILGFEIGPFLKSNGGQIYLFPPSVNNGRIECNMAVGEASPPGVSGSGTVLTLLVRGRITSTTTLEFLSARMRDHTNAVITPRSLVSGQLRFR